MTQRVLTRRINALAQALRRMARSTTGLRRSLTIEAQRLVDLEDAGDGVIRSLGPLRRTLQKDV